MELFDRLLRNIDYKVLVFYLIMLHSIYLSYNYPAVKFIY